MTHTKGDNIVFNESLNDYLGGDVVTAIHDISVVDNGYIHEAMCKLVLRASVINKDGNCLNSNCQQRTQ